MIKITSAQWEQLEKHSKTLNDSMLLVLVNEIRASNTKLPKDYELVLVSMGKDQPKQERPGKQLSKYWYLVAPQVDSMGKPKGSTRTLTHGPSGLQLGEYKNQLAALKVWEVLKKYDIEHEDSSKIEEPKGDWDYILSLQV